MSYHCPKCQGLVYNRRHKLCGFCGTELPPEMLFTQAEIEALDKEAAEQEERRKRRAAKEQEMEAELQRAADSIPFFLP